MPYINFSLKLAHVQKKTVILQTNCVFRHRNSSIINSLINCVHAGFFFEMLFESDVILNLV